MTRYRLENLVPHKHGHRLSLLKHDYYSLIAAARQGLELPAIMAKNAQLGPLTEQVRQLTSDLSSTKAKLQQLEESHDKEIGEFQNDVRNKLIELTGAPDSSIDGAGSDAGWQEFTLAEIEQGVGFLLDKLQQLETAKECAQAAEGCAQGAVQNFIDAHHNPVVASLNFKIKQLETEIEGLRRDRELLDVAESIADTNLSFPQKQLRLTWNPTTDSLRSRITAAMKETK